MKSCSAKRLAGKSVSICSDAPIENGPSSPKEADAELNADVRNMAATVVDHVVRMASTRAAQSCHQNGLLEDDAQQRARRDKILAMQKLPTIQIDSVESLPPSPSEESPPPELRGEADPLDDSEIEIELEPTEGVSDFDVDEVKNYVTTYVQDILTKAMMVAEKKLQFAGVPEEIDDLEDEDEVEAPEEPQDVQESSPPRENDEEIRAAAAQIVEEVLAKACELVKQRTEVAQPSYPDLPMIQIDTVASPPRSPASDDDSLADTRTAHQCDLGVTPAATSEEADLISFDEAPDEVRELATKFIKDLVARAIALAEEKMVPTVPFNFADVDLMKGTGPWYIRAREALVRLLRTACFCTPRRHDS